MTELKKLTIVQLGLPNHLLETPSRQIEKGVRSLLSSGWSLPSKLLKLKTNRVTKATTFLCQINIRNQNMSKDMEMIGYTKRVKWNLKRQKKIKLKKSSIVWKKLAGFRGPSSSVITASSGREITPPNKKMKISNLLIPMEVQGV